MISGFSRLIEENERIPADFNFLELPVIAKLVTPAVMAGYKSCYHYQGVSSITPPDSPASLPL